VIEFIWFCLQALLWPVVLVIAAIASVVGFLLPYIAAVVGIALALVIVATAIGGLVTGSIWDRLKVLAWIVAMGTMFALPYLVHNRGWDALGALVALIAFFTYNQVREH
jgi:hypothetical protein